MGLSVMTMALLSGFLFWTNLYFILRAIETRRELTQVREDMDLLQRVVGRQIKYITGHLPEQTVKRAEPKRKPEWRPSITELLNSKEYERELSGAPDKFPN